MPTTPPAPSRSVAIERHPWWPYLLWAMLLGVLGVTAVTYFDKVYEEGSAILRWRPQILDLARGVDVYAKYRYPNTPFTALLLYPIAVLPPVVGAMALYVIKAAMAVIAGWWAVDLAAGRRRGPVPLWALLVVGILAARPMISDLQHGNINIVVLFFVMAGLRLFSRDRTLASGVLLGLAAVLKVTPGLFLLYFAWKRQWRAAAGFILGGVAGVVLPALVVGPLTNFELHRAWFDQMIVPFVTDTGTEYASHINQSLPGLMMRLLTDEGIVDLPGPGEDPSIQIVSLDPDVVSLMLRVAILAVLVALAVLCRRAHGDRRDWRWAAEFSLVLIAMLLLSERTWKHHFVTILLPLAVVTMHLALDRPSPNLRRGLIATLAAFFALTALTSGEIIGWIYRDVAHKFVEAAGTFFWAAVLLFVAVSTLVWRTPREDGDATDPA